MTVTLAYRKDSLLINAMLKDLHESLIETEKLTGKPGFVDSYWPIIGDTLISQPGEARLLMTTAMIDNGFLNRIVMNMTDSQLCSEYKHGGWRIIADIPGSDKIGNVSIRIDAPVKVPYDAQAMAEIATLIPTQEKRNDRTTI
jgi:hypothetical protein